MNNAKTESDHQKQNKSHLQAIDVSILFASSFFWAWYHLAILNPTLFAPFESFIFFDPYRLVALASTLVSLLFWYIKQNLALRLLNSRRWEIALVGMATLGNAITSCGAYIDSMVIVALGGFVVGSMASYFMLAWSRMYSRRGSGSTAASITGAFSIGFALSLLIGTMQPVAAAITTATLPFLVVIVLIGVQALYYSSSNPDTDITIALHDKPDRAFGAADVFFDSREKASRKTTARQAHRQNEESGSQIPTALTLGFILFGFAFGYDIYTTPSDTAGILVIVSCLLTALMLFVLAIFKPEWLVNAFLVGILCGIAGYTLIPSLGLGDFGYLCSKILANVGSVSFITAVWTLLADMTIITKNMSIAVFASGLLRCYAGIVIGFACSVFLHLNADTLIIPDAGLYSILGFTFIIGLLLMFVGNQATWKNLRISLSGNSKVPFSVSNQPQSESYTTRDHLKVLIEVYRLTGREGEILELLVAGRSRTRIAKALYVSENTVNTHVQHIYRKMNVSNVQELLDFVD